MNRNTSIAMLLLAGLLPAAALAATPIARAETSESRTAANARPSDVRNMFR